MFPQKLILKWAILPHAVNSTSVAFRRQKQSKCANIGYFRIKNAISHFTNKAKWQ